MTERSEEFNTLHNDNQELKSYLTEQKGEEKSELQQIEKELREKLDITQKLLEERED
jgi:hypothetical protein